MYHFILLLIMLQDQPRLTDTLGKNEFLILSEPYPISSNQSIDNMRLIHRLESRDYTRVHKRPTAPGTFFWGKNNFRIYRKAYRFLGKWVPEQQFTLKLAKNGTISGWIQEDGSLLTKWKRQVVCLEPTVLAESLSELRAPRISLAYDAFPTDLINALLAGEDARFFEHHGLDSKAIARSMLKNVKAGKIVMGGSTLTQQLIKNRDLTPKRSFGRKASEAIRALILESEYEKEEILEAYMNHVYLGHSSGKAIYGFPMASQIYFSKSLKKLSLAQNAYLAGMVQGPNHFHPVKNRKRGKKRRDWVLSRMKKLNWITGQSYSAAINEQVYAKISKPKTVNNLDFYRWTHRFLKEIKPSYFKAKKGGIIYTTMDPLVQEKADHALKRILPKLARRVRQKKGSSLEGLIVCMDLETGGILAYSNHSTLAKNRHFDRIRLAKRQPGSTIKPFVLLTAFDRFRNPLYPGTLVKDSPFILGKEPYRWQPKNYDKKFHGVVSLRQALVQSYNIPIAKTAHYIGFKRFAATLEKMDIHSPNPLPPSISLGSVETSPLKLLQAYSTLFCGGKMKEAVPLFGVDKPSGKKLKKVVSHTRKVAKSSSSYLVFDLLKDAMRNGTGRSAQLSGKTNQSWSAGKTGTSSNYRDAWFAGASESLLTVVWIGRDDNFSLGLPSSQTASLLWRTFMEGAVPLRPKFTVEKPKSIKTCKVNPTSGLRVLGVLPGYREEIYRRGGSPDREVPWKTNKRNIIE